jgi:hypothetical protein
MQLAEQRNKRRFGGQRDRTDGVDERHLDLGRDRDFVEKIAQGKGIDGRSWIGRQMSSAEDPLNTAWADICARSSAAKSEMQARTSAKNGQRVLAEAALMSGPGERRLLHFADSRRAAKFLAGEDHGKTYHRGSGGRVRGQLDNGIEASGKIDRVRLSHRLELMISWDTNAVVRFLNAHKQADKRLKVAHSVIGRAISHNMSLFFRLSDRAHKVTNL